MKQKHVQEWEKACSLSSYSEQREACENLLSKWLYDKKSHYQIAMFGTLYEGPLDSVNDNDLVIFTIVIADPVDSNRNMYISAPYEQFALVKENYHV